MGHETLIFGFIRSPHVAWERQFPLFARNRKEIQKLPSHDEYPALSRGMFMVPKSGNRSLWYRSQMIHFGMSGSHIEFGHVPEWLDKFEGLLSRLYWRSAEVHVITECYGPHRLAWEMDYALMDTYREGRPQPTSKWTRTLLAGTEPVPKH